MPVDPQICSSTLRKLDTQFSRLKTKPSPASVHKFRTHSRRVETWFQELVPESDRSDRKLIKTLCRLRKKAGKVRDLDVQLELLQSLNVPQELRLKTRLICVMQEERDRREKKFRKALHSASIPRIRKQLKHAFPISELRADADPLQIARGLFSRISHSQAAVTEKRLHEFRIQGKKARYIAELSGDTAEAKRIVSALKNMQDVIGDWHDWLQLGNRAEELFSEVHDSALLSALRNIRRAKFRHAIEVLAATRVELTHSPEGSIERKPAAAIHTQRKAIA